MPAIGMFLLWGGYTLTFWGYCRLQGYNISIGELVVPGRYTGSWPPPLIDDNPNPMGGPSHNGVAPGQHPGDMPYTYPSTGQYGTASATSTGGVQSV